MVVFRAFAFAGEEGGGCDGGLLREEEVMDEGESGGIDGIGVEGIRVEGIRRENEEEN
jgi:hypothetical protein